MDGVQAAVEGGNSVMALGTSAVSFRSHILIWELCFFFYAENWEGPFVSSACLRGRPPRLGGEFPNSPPALIAAAIISSVAPALLNASITNCGKVGSIIGPPHVSPGGCIVGARRSR